MCRFLGYVCGIIFQLGLFGSIASSGSASGVPFLMLGILNVILIFLIILFRGLSAASSNFEKVYADFLENKVNGCLSMCSGITIMPETTYHKIYYDSYNNQLKTE